MFEPTNEIKGRYDITNNIVTGEASCFIIPNGAGACKDFLCGAERKAEEFRKFYELNKMEGFDPETTKLIQVWWHSDECFGTNNMFRHGCYAIDTDGNGYSWGINIPEYLPLDILKDVKEGDTISINVPIWIRRTDDKDSKAADATAEIKLTFQQKGYRYERFGNFEEVVKYVL